MSKLKTDKKPIQEIQNEFQQMLRGRKMTPEVAQEIQDEIFRRYPEKKIRLKAQMLEFARELSSHKREVKYRK